MAFLAGIGNIAANVRRDRDSSNPSTGGSLDAGTLLSRRLAPTFQSAFRSTLGTMLADAVGGRFEDPHLTAEADSLVRRLATRQASDGAAAVGANPTASVAGGGGADAAPAPAPAASLGVELIADERRLLEVYSQQAQQRLGRVSSSLNDRFQAGHSLPPAASGRLDYRNFRPKDKAEAQAFAERLAIDLTVGAAKLEAVATELDLVRHDAQHSPSTANAATVKRLEVEYERQQQYVLDLADVVDGVSGDSISGVQASADNGQLGKVISNAVRDGATHHDVAKLRKLHSLVVDEAATGNSALVNNVQQNVVSMLLQMQLRSEHRKTEQQRRDNERAHEEQRLSQRSAERRSEDARADALAAQRRAQRTADLTARYRPSG